MPLPAAEAQEWCNFVVWQPFSLPAGLAWRATTVRRESRPGRAGEVAGHAGWTTNNPAAFRAEIAGDGRRGRLKQFLYDWAFPALDHPCLWRSSTRAVPLDDRYVLWFGTDHLGNAAASVRMARTMIEWSALEGEFSDDEVLAIFSSLAPVDPVAAKAIADTPFAALSYWARSSDAPMIDVPIGLWRLRRWSDEDAHEGRWGHQAEVPAALGGFTVDSVAVFGAETECVYTGGPDRGHELRLIVQRSGAGRLELPPVPEEHPCHVSGGLAYIDERYGPFDAVVALPGHDVRLLSSSGVGMDRAWFADAVAQVSEHYR
ncbi:hypothetical protein ACWGE0_03095 [Lentzea sp. NPDC054927]